MAKKQDITKHGSEELAKMLADKREELRALRFNVAGSKNRDVKLASKIRKDIARTLTQINKNSHGN